MLSKRMYIKPVLESETFVPQNYIAACGDSGKIYKFTCDGGGGQKGDVYTNSGTNLTEGISHYYHACNTKHDAPSEDEFIRGTFIANGGNDQKRHWVWDGISQGHMEDYPSIPVIIWTDGGTNVHCTENLDITSWETTKS